MNKQHLLKNERIIEIGDLDLSNGIITIKDGMKDVDCRLWHYCGDIYFVYEGEEIYLRDL